MEPDLITPLDKAITALDRFGYCYALIGDVALTQWKIVRLTYDIDIKILVPNFDYATTRNFLYTAFPEKGRIDSPGNQFIVSVKIDGVIVDFLLCLPGYEQQIIERAVQRKLGDITVWVSTPEDLIIQKAITKRAKDWQDIEDLLIVQFEQLDYPYIENWLIQFADILEQPEILMKYRTLVEKASNISKTNIR
jgi:hypothetical protein